MIKNPFYISKKNQRCQINLGVNVDPFDRKNEVCSHVWYEGIVGVGWSNSNSIIDFNNSFGQIFAYPTPDLSKMVVIYSDEEVAMPDNAVVLNDDGSRYCQLKAPKRLSSPVGRRLPKGGLTGFMQVGWHENKDFMKADFYIGDSDFIETRLLKMADFTFDNEYYKTWRL